MPQNYFSEIYEKSILPYCVINSDYAIIKVNDSYTNITETYPSDILGKNIFELFSEESRTYAEDTLSSIFETGAVFGINIELLSGNSSKLECELEVRTRYSPETMELVAYCLFKPYGWDSSCRRNYSEYVMSLLSLNSSTVIVDIETMSIVDVNNFGCELYGYSYKEMLSKSVKELTGDDTSMIKANHDKILSGEITFFETTVLSKDNRNIDLQIHPTVININNKKYLLMFKYDITQKKEEERMLMIISEIHSAFLEKNEGVLFNKVLDVLLRSFNAGYGLVGYIDQDGAFVSPSIMESVYHECNIENKSIKLKPEEWEGMCRETLKSGLAYFKNEDLILPNGHIHLYNYLSVAIKNDNDIIGLFIVGNKPGGFSYTDQKRARRIADMMAPVLLNWRNNLIYKQDLEKLNTSLEAEVQAETLKRKKNEDILFEQKKFIDMGQMINAIAHQWRQPLNNINLLSSIMYDMHEGINYEVSYKKLYDQQQEIIQFLSNTIDDFRNFFTPDKKPVEFSLLSELNFALKLLNAQLNNNQIDLKLICKCNDKVVKCFDEIIQEECGHKKDTIYGYPNEIRQVFVNIVNNAQDAIKESFKVNSEMQKEIIVTVSMEATRVIIEFFNYGLSIGEEIIHRVFDPYFTTKEEGKGTGIGLYMSKNIIENNMSGKLTCKNKPGGVSFYAAFPVEAS